MNVRSCDHPQCTEPPERGFLYCAKHLGEEIARWLRQEG